MRTLVPVALAFAVAFLGGCAAFSKATPVDVRYFSPEPADRDDPPVARHDEVGTRLCVGRITSSALLRNRILYRESSFELATYDDFRWTEYPEAYLRRALVRSLFEDHRFAQVLGGHCPTLDVELIAFEEVRRGTARLGRVQVGYRLHENQAVLASGVMTRERPATGEGPTPVVAAVGAALREATARIADVIEARLPVDAAAAAR
jgi:ABC-type uncharacterized transport system auxiliary subunit